jgi:hypothetical protein
MSINVAENKRQREYNCGQILDGGPPLSYKLLVHLCGGRRGKNMVNDGNTTCIRACYQYLGW